jgi:hypothetical protein
MLILRSLCCRQLHRFVSSVNLAICYYVSLIRLLLLQVVFGVMVTLVDLFKGALDEKSESPYEAGASIEIIGFDAMYC